MDELARGTATDPTTGILRAREALIDQIASQIADHGYFLTHLDPQSPQLLVDLRWAAQAAGRTLGRRTRTLASAVGAREPGKVSVLVAPDETCTVTDERGHSRPRTLLEVLVDRHDLVASPALATA
jgi:hypothetical protein